MMTGRNIKSTETPKEMLDFLWYNLQMEENSGLGPHLRLAYRKLSQYLANPINPEVTYLKVEIDKLQKENERLRVKRSKE